MRRSKSTKRHFSSVTRIRIRSTARSARGRAKRPPNGVPRINVPHPNGADASAHCRPLAWALHALTHSNRMKILSVNTHLTYPGWSEGKLNLAFMDLAKAFFVERGHQVAETFVERGYDPEEEVKKHVAADLVILQTPVNWFSAPWIYKKYVDEVFNVGLAKEVLLVGDGRTRQDPSRQYGTGGKM